jgi:hypothetical protein
MRRRILSETEKGVITTSPSAETVSYLGGYIDVTLYWNGEILKDDGVTAEPQSAVNNKITSVVYDKNTGIARITYETSYNTYNNTSTANFTYHGQKFSFSLTQTPNSIELDVKHMMFTSGGNTGINYLKWYDGAIATGLTPSITAPDWATITYDETSGEIRVTPNSYSGSENRKGTAVIVAYGHGGYTFYLYQYAPNYVSSLPLVEGQRAIPFESKNIYWSLKNVGASADYDDGKLYQWGAGSTEFQCGSEQYSTYASNSLMPASADTATQVLGTRWRTPKYGEGVWQSNLFGYYVYANNQEKKGIIYFDDSTKNLMFLPYVEGKKYDSGTCTDDIAYNYWWNIPASQYSARVMDMTSLGSPVEVSKRCGAHVRGVLPMISLSQSSESVEGSSTSTYFNVIVDGSNYRGTIALSSSAGWVSASNYNGVITLTYSSNPSTTDSRSATITVTALSQTKTFSLTQEELAPSGDNPGEYLLCTTATTITLNSYNGDSYGSHYWWNTVYNYSNAVLIDVYDNGFYYFLNHNTNFTHTSFSMEGCLRQLKNPGYISVSSSHNVLDDPHLYGDYEAASHVSPNSPNTATTMSETFTSTCTCRLYLYDISFLSSLGSEGTFIPYSGSILSELDQHVRTFIDLATITVVSTKWSFNSFGCLDDNNFEVTSVNIT